MKGDLFKLIDEIWLRDWSDLPWTRSPLKIAAPGRVEGGTFQFLVDGGSGSVCICPQGRPAGGGVSDFIPPSAYRLSLAPQDSGIVLHVDPGWYVDELVVEQAGPSYSQGRLAVLWLDHEAGEWEVLYNSHDRQRRLLEALAETMASEDILFRDDMLQFVRHLFENQPKKATTVLERSEPLREQSHGLAKVCERFEFQLNAHGLKRTFRFWSMQEKVAYLEGTRALIASLRELSDHVCLGFGAVLGLVRDQDLIGHDDDLDVLVAFDARQVPDLASALELTTSCLHRHGHKVSGTFFSHLWVSTPEGGRADVFVGLIEQDGALSFYPSARRSLQFSDVFPARPELLCGVELAVPADCRTYLVCTYGQSWDQPDIGFSHPWDRQSYADIAGKRIKPAKWTRGEKERLAREQIGLTP